MIEVTLSDTKSIKLLQQGLISLGYYPDGGADGIWGNSSKAKYKEYMASRKVNPLVGDTLGSPFPTDEIKELIKFYGKPDFKNKVAPRQTRAKFPYPMRLSWDLNTTVSSTYCHELVKNSLERIFKRILDEIGMEGIRQYGLDIFGGMTNVRYMRGGEAQKLISRHSFGIAIDINPLENGLRTPWPSKATMPERAIRIFEEEGWTSFARARGIDAMHFQASSNYVGD